MPSSPEREFALPRRRRVPWWAWLVAVALHVPVVLLLISNRRHAPLLVAPEPGLSLADTTTMLTLPRSHRAAGASPRVAATPNATPVPTPSLAIESLPVAAQPGRPVSADSAPAPDPSASLYPHYGTGRLWVHPLEESPRKIASALTGKTDAQLDDSIIAAMVQAYLNQMAVENREHPSTLPSWTTKVGGKTVGLDQRWIYLGPIKVPTALLALLPIKLQANPTEAEFNAKWQQMRSDLMEAARRSATLDDFKQAVKELHDQTEQRRQFMKNQRTPPDSSHLE